MSDSQRNSTGDRTNENGLGANRRRVLQGIGAAGVASAIMTGSGSAQVGEGPRAQADVAVQQWDRTIPTSSQFYSFNALLNDGSTNADLIEMSGEAGLDAYEPYNIGADTDQSDIDAILDAEESAGVYMSSAHVGLSEIEDDPQGIADVFTQFEHDGRNPALIEPGTGDWNSEQGVLDVAERLNAAADEMADHDIQVGYHNHEHEFEYLDDADERAYDVFAQAVEDPAFLQLDVAWVFAGVDRPDPIQYIVEYGDKIKSLHMKNWTANDSRTHGSGDAGNGELAEIHEGDLNMRAIATAARNASEVDHLVYEYDNTPTPEESFQAAGEWLNKVNHPWSPGGICAIEGADTHPAKIHQPNENI